MIPQNQDRYGMEWLTWTNAHIEQLSLLQEGRNDEGMDGSVASFLQILLENAVEAGASDLHLEPFEHRFRIRMCKNGCFSELGSPPHAIGLALVARIKVIADLDVAETRTPQDGKITDRFLGRSVDFRVATLPTRFGESVALRVLDRGMRRLDLADLGMPPELLEKVSETIFLPHGIFLVTGPTGSGKTTTLYSALAWLNTPDCKVVTVEDPVEYELEGAVQVQTQATLGLDFVHVLRAFLRHDPDKIMVGEIRDSETASVAVQASLTGHMVFSTLHCGNAPGAITRLTHLGVAPCLLAASLAGVLAQRLLRRLNPMRREAWMPDCRTLRMLGYSIEDLHEKPFFKADTVQNLPGEAFCGRVGLFEYLHLSDRLRDGISRELAPAEFAHEAVGEGWVPLRKAALGLLLEGQTTVEEVLQHT